MGAYNPKRWGKTAVANSRQRTARSVIYEISHATYRVSLSLHLDNVDIEYKSKFFLLERWQNISYTPTTNTLQCESTVQNGDILQSEQSFYLE